MEVHIPGLIAIIVFYLLILCVGLWAARKTGLKKGQASSDDVMLAGRNIGLLVGCFTMTATWVGGGFINGSAEIIVNGGLVWCQAPIGYGISLFLGGYFFAEKMRKRNYSTMLDPFTRKYGDLMGALLYIPALLGELFWSAAILSALGATLTVILGLEAKISIIISAGISLLYTLLGGLYSVAYTDVIQLICIFIGLWISVPFAMVNEAVSSLTENSTTTWIGSVANADIGIYVDAFLLLMFGGMPWQVYFQRVLSAKTVSIAKYLSYVAGVGCIVMALPAVLIGAIAANTDWNMTAYSNNGNSSSIHPDDYALTLPLVLRYLTPDAVSFIGLGAVSAAVMSSTDSSFLSASSMFARNVFGVIYFNITKKQPSHRLTIWMMRLMQLVLAACACAIAIAVNSIYYLFILCSDLVYVILFPQLVCAVYLRGSNTYGSLAGFVIGIIIRLLSGEPGLGLDPVLIYPWYDSVDGQKFPFRTLCMLITYTSIIVVSYSVRYLFLKGILPEGADFFHCFYNKPTMTFMSEPQGELTKTGGSVDVSDLPPGYQPYVESDGIEVNKKLNRKGFENPAFDSGPVYMRGTNGNTPSQMNTRL